jgi:hypothetical protein
MKTKLSAEAIKLIVDYLESNEMEIDLIDICRYWVEERPDYVAHEYGLKKSDPIFLESDVIETLDFKTMYAGKTSKGMLVYFAD